MPPKAKTENKKASFTSSVSWKTSSAAIASIIATILSLVVVPLIDSDESTKPQYAEAVSIISAGVGLLFARDNNKTSEDIGLK